MSSQLLSARAGQAPQSQPVPNSGTEAARARAKPNGAPTRKGDECPPESTEEEESKEREIDVDDFFNIREANPDVERGEFEFELGVGWFEGAGDRQVTATAELNYGITNDLMIELEVAPLDAWRIHDVGQGDLGLLIFNRFYRESEHFPALAGWAEMRVPTSKGSSGVDGSLHAGITKTISPRLRTHVNGFIATLNGGESEEDRADRRHFQWGLGPGFDYQFDDCTLGVLNFLHQSSEREGSGNESLLELGVVRKLAHNQELKLAFDIGLDRHHDSTDYSAKLQWEIEFK